MKKTLIAFLIGGLVTGQSAWGWPSSAMPATVLTQASDAMKTEHDEHYRAAEECLMAQRIEAAITMNNDRMIQAYADQVKSMNVSPETSKLVTDYTAKIHELVSTSMSWKNMREDYIKAYAKIYSIDELKGITAFYKSEVGQTMMDKNPLVTAEIVQATKWRVSDIQPKLNDLRLRLADDFKVIQEKKAEAQKAEDAKKPKEKEPTLKLPAAMPQKPPFNMDVKK